MNEPCGWWCMRAEAFLEAMQRAHAGEDPMMIYMEYYANSEIETAED